MANQNKLKLAREWFRKARDDEKSIRAILKEGGAFSTACFLSHQMAEKYLKGFLVAKGKTFRKIHDLPYFLNRCQKIEKDFKNLENECGLLNGYYIPPRYPVAYVEIYSEEKAKEAFKAAKKIKNFILKKINE